MLTLAACVLIVHQAKFRIAITADQNQCTSRLRPDCLTRSFLIRGTISIGCSGTLFVACTGHDFQAFGLLDTAYRHTYTVPGRVKALIPKDTAFAEEGKTLVGGTDSGMAIVYDAESGKAIQNLEYPRGGLVQPVAV